MVNEGTNSAKCRSGIIFRHVYFGHAHKWTELQVCCSRVDFSVSPQLVLSPILDNTGHGRAWLELCHSAWCYGRANWVNYRDPLQTAGVSRFSPCSAHVDTYCRGLRHICRSRVEQGAGQGNDNQHDAGICRKRCISIGVLVHGRHSISREEP